MSDWRTRGSDNRDVGVCHFCNEKSTHFNANLFVDVCDDPQCLDEEILYGDAPTRDLVDIFNDNEEFEEGKEED